VHRSVVAEDHTVSLGELAQMVVVHCVILNQLHFAPTVALIERSHILLAHPVVKEVFL